MPPDKNQNINLLPNDLERQRQVIKKIIAQAAPEYTVAGGAAGRPETTKPFWPRIFKFHSGAKAETKSTAKVLAVKPTRLPTRLKPKAAPPAAPPAPVAPNFLPPSAAPALFAPTAAGAPLPPPVEAKPLPPAPEAPVTAPAAEIPPPEPRQKGEENFGVNLLSAEYAHAFSKQNQTAFFSYAAGSAVILLSLIYGGLHLYQLRTARQVASSQQSNTELAAVIASFSDLDKEDQVLGRKAAAIKELLAAHISTAAFLKKLEAVTIPEVTFLALAASGDGNITITARATSYTTLGRQLAVLQAGAPWVKEVTVAAAVLAQSSPGQAAAVEFDMALKVDPKIFKAEELE